MWKIRFRDHAEPKLRHYEVSNPNHRFRIYANLGCSLQEITVDGKEILDGISNDEDGLKDYGRSFKSAILFPFPNRIDKGKYSFEGPSYQLDCNDPLDNAIHGLVYDGEFLLSKEIAEAERAQLDFKYVSDRSWDGFPFPFELQVSYSFLSSGQMNLGFKVINTGEKTLPFGLGWHPYFKAEELNRTLLEMPVEDTFLVTDNMIPHKRQVAQVPDRFEIANREFDDAFTLKKGQCTLETKSYRLYMEFDAAQEAYLQIYIPPHRQSIAIEPMTCLADAFNNGIGLQTLKPGESSLWEVRMGWQIKH